MTESSRLNEMVVELYRVLKKANVEAMAGRKCEANRIKKEDAYPIRNAIHKETGHVCHWEADSNGYVYALFLDGRVRPETAAL